MYARHGLRFYFTLNAPNLPLQRTVALMFARSGGNISPFPCKKTSLESDAFGGGCITGS